MIDFSISLLDYEILTIYFIVYKAKATRKLEIKDN